jgi:ATP-dependent Clp protease protease subunit
MRLFIVIMMLLAMLSVNAAETPRKEIVLTKDNTLVLNESFRGSSVSSLIGQAKEMDASLKSGYPIYLFLSTPGGSIQAGLELIEFLEGLNRPVHTITLFSASMGFQLVQHLGKRYILKYGVLMSHKAAGGFRGEFGGGSSQIDSRYGLWLRRLQMMDKQTVNRTNGKKTLKQYQSEYDNELWLNGEEAVRNGYADAVVSVKCSESLNGSTSKTVRYYGFNVKLTFDNCPIRTFPIKAEALVRTTRGYMSLDKFMEDGGKFGKDCRESDTKAKKGWNNEVVEGPKKAELCLMDKTLTLEEIEQGVEEEKVKISNQRKNVVKMSFSNFVSEM